VCQEVGSIDGFPIRDDKGELYLIWKEDANSVKKPTPIWGQRMNEERTALEGEKFELFRNTPNTWEGGLVEGPALLKRNGYYYMFYAGDACCGRACTYGVGVARAKNLKGPWERFSGNPILKKNNEWQCPGHGTVVTDSKGRDFFLYHAYNAKSTVYPGRQGLLDEVIWNDNGWPSFKNNTPSITAAAPFNENAPDSLNVTDEFAHSNLGQTWQWPVNEKPQFTLVANNNGLLSLKASPEAIGTVLGQRTYTADYTATTALNKSKLPAGTMAGLSAIGDNGNAVGLSVRNGDMVLWSMRENKFATLAKAPAPQSEVLQLKLTTTNGDKMQFAYSTDGTTWTPMNNGQAFDASYLPPWDRGVRVGFTAKGPATATATFDYFKLVNAAK
jgi:beta-xylosidase